MVNHKIKECIKHLATLNFTVCFLFFGCGGAKPLKNPKREMEQPNVIKMNGYYAPSGKIVRFYFFYLDGTVCTSFLPIEQWFDSKYKSIPSHWGVFHVSNDSLLIEEWTISHGGKSPTERSYGKLSNDTTLFISKRENAYATKQGELWEMKNDTFHFFPKLDSLNPFTN